ncbi:MAG: right-handed parallel beta-helix repeat-containing protein [Fibrobacter sp.]|nr:right-handed parallel beta-helix repeat-containing protein [Fibrobacter sp.]
MKNISLFSIIALTTTLVFAQEPAAPVQGTPINGPVHGFIKAEQSPYLVTQDLTVESNQVLVIVPGVKLQFAPGTGLYVKGQLVVAGTVEFVSASSNPQSGDWKGIFLTGSESSEIRNAVISGAANGIVAENTNVSILSSKIEKTSGRGVYAKNSKISISGSQFEKNEGAAVHIDSYSDATISDVKFNGNNVALYNSALAMTNVVSSSFENNTCAILDMGNSHLTFDNSSVSKNKVGASAGDVLEKGVIESIHENETDFNKDFNSIAQALPASPEIPGVESRAVDEKENIGVLLAQKEAEEVKADSVQKSWSILGNVMIGNHYHHVMTRKNHGKRTIEVFGDSIKPGERYNNTFQVPGFGTEASIYLLMQSPDGKTIEFSGDYTGDEWNRFSPTPVTLTYTDAQRQIILGDFTKVGGEIYMAGLPVFGLGVSRYAGKNNVNQPLFEVDAYIGENRKPYLVGDRHPDIYKNYIEDGEAQAQRMVYGASVKWSPLRRFNAKFGYIYAEDEIEDPLLRDGSTKSYLTSEPMQDAFTIYADGNWLFYPGDIELNGQIAFGHADTADVYRERAINEVFTKAGLNTASMPTLRKLMMNENKINSLSAEELDEIFGGNTTLSRKQMREELRKQVEKAKKLQKEYESDRDEDRVLGLNWGSQDFALGASLYWNIYKTTISGHLKYVGENYYSAGSPDQLADTREFGGDLEQIITNFWTLHFGYLLNIENAASGSKTNIFGLGEGTHWGLFNDDDSKWFEEHELDYNRTKYIQNWNLGNSFKIGKKVNVDVGYNLEYRTQYRPYQLHNDPVLEDGIYKDGWFAARKDKAVTTIVCKGDTTEVDSARWAEYKGLSDQEYIASKFQERIYKNSWSLDLSVQAHKTIFKAGGRWTIRTDDSKFYKDDLIDNMDLANTTWAKLGYYFGGADYFEHTYPLSATTTLKQVQNQFGFTPRLKNYKRNDMTEREFTVNDELEISFLRRFLILTISGEFRYMTTNWEENDKDFDETETDVLGSTSLRVNHTQHLSTEWYTGTALYYRPDNLTDEYKDIYGGVRVNYVF